MDWPALSQQLRTKHSDSQLCQNGLITCISPPPKENTSKSESYFPICVKWWGFINYTERSKITDSAKLLVQMTSGTYLSTIPSAQTSNPQPPLFSFFSCSLSYQGFNKNVQLSLVSTGQIIQLPYPPLTPSIRVSECYFVWPVLKTTTHTHSKSNKQKQYPQHSKRETVCVCVCECEREWVSVSVCVCVSVCVHTYVHACVCV